MKRRLPLMFLLLACGCTSRPAWEDDPKAATVAYWLDQPAAASVASRDYRELWDAADNARRRFRFDASRSDYRGGVLGTEPVVSPQPFEVWRDELRSSSARAESALATVRRSLRFEFGRLADGGFFVEPKVVVERQSLGERRITNAIDYRGVLGGGSQKTERADEPATTQPSNYWYAVGRDAALERSLANRIARRSGGRLSDGPAVNVTRRADDALVTPATTLPSGPDGGPTLPPPASATEGPLPPL